MQARYEREISNHRGIHIRQSQSGMFGKNMTAAGFAKLAMALRRFGVGANVLRAPRNLHAFWLPQGEGVDGASRPMAARTAVTIAHARGLTGHRELDRATEATSIVTLWATRSTSSNLYSSRLLIPNPGVQLMGLRLILARRYFIRRSDMSGW